MSPYNANVTIHYLLRVTFSVFIHRNSTGSNSMQVVKNSTLIKQIQQSRTLIAIQAIH